MRELPSHRSFAHWANLFLQSNFPGSQSYFLKLQDISHFWIDLNFCKDLAFSRQKMRRIWVRGKRVLDPKRVLGPFKISSTLFPLFLEPFELSSTLFPPLQEPFRLSSTLFPPSQKCSKLSSTLFPPLMESLILKYKTP